MKRDEITHTKLTALIWAGVLAPAAELLPALMLPLAGRAAWLTPAWAIPLVLLAGWLLGGLAGERGPAHTIRAGLGPWAGRGVLAIYLVWCELLLALRLRLCAQRLLPAGERDGSLWFFLAVVSALVLWMGLGKLSAFARAGQIFLVVLFAVGAVVLLLSVSQVRIERLIPLTWEEGGKAARAALSAAGVLGWGWCGAFLCGQVARGEDRGRWHWAFWGAGGCFLLLLAQGVIIGNLGSVLAGRLDNPFFALAKSVGVEGAFQRVESLVIALWTLADLTMAGLLLFAQRALWRELGPAETDRKASVVLMILAVVLAWAAFSEEGDTLYWSWAIVPAGNLLLGLLVPLLLRMLLALCERWRKAGISCGQNGGESGRYSCSEKDEKKTGKNEKKC